MLSEIKVCEKCGSRRGVIYVAISRDGSYLNVAVGCLECGYEGVGKLSIELANICENAEQVSDLPVACAA